MPPEFPHWLLLMYYSSPAVALLIAVGTAVIQMYTQRQEWKRNLYPYRHNIYLGIYNHSKKLLDYEGNQTTDIDARRFETTAHAQCVCNDKVVEFLKDYFGAAKACQSAFMDLKFSRADGKEPTAEEIAQKEAIL